MSFDEVFQQGVKSFQAQDFEKAAAFFTQALDLEPQNTTALVNLATAQFKLGQKAAAYAYYKKALHIDPQLSTAQQGLEFVKTQIQIREIPHRIETYERMREFFIEPVSFALPLILSLVLFAYWGYRTIKHLGSKKKAYFAGEDPSAYGITNWILTALFALTLSWLFFFKYDAGLQRGIVKVEAVPVRSSPSESGPEILQLYGGLEVRILRSQDGWLQVEYPGATAGWVPPGSVISY